MTPAIRTVGLVKDYGKVRALDGLDLAVESGQVFGFLGPNGAGKSTTIRLLLDLLRPTAGTVEVLGQSPREGGPALRARIGYLPGERAARRCSCPRTCWPMSRRSRAAWRSSGPAGWWTSTMCGPCGSAPARTS